VPGFGKKTVSVKAMGRNAERVMESRPAWAKARIEFPDTAGLIDLEAPGVGFETHMTRVYVPIDPVDTARGGYNMLVRAFLRGLSREKRLLLNEDVERSIHSAVNAKVEELLSTLKGIMNTHGAEGFRTRILNEASDVMVVELQLQPGIASGG
jgi:hypothetical protein